MVSHALLHTTVRHNYHLTCLEAQGPTLVAKFRGNCIKLCHDFSVKIHVYSAFSVHPVFLPHFVHPAFQFFLFIPHVTFSFHKMISAEAEISSTFHPHTITHHPGATVEAFASGGRPRHCRGILIYVADRDQISCQRNVLIWKLHFTRDFFPTKYFPTTCSEPFHPTHNKML